MKTLENKGVEFAEDVDYFKLIESCVNVTPEKGFTVKEMKKRLRVLDALNGDKTAEIEDADFKVLKNCVEQMKWAIMHKEIVDFVDYIENV